MIEEVRQGRQLVTPADRAYVGGGALAGVLLDLIALSRRRDRRLSLTVVREYAGERGISWEGDVRDLWYGIKRWKRRS